MRNNTTRFETLYKTALDAGATAARNITPTPMTVVAHTNPLDDNSPATKSYFVPDGVCGFGWVSLKGNTAFGRWAKKNGFARRGYPTGLRISSKLMTQSLARNEAWAEGFAAVLRENGIDAYGQSRID